MATDTRNSEIDMKRREALKASYQGIKENLEQGILPFWIKNGIDHQYGGYLLDFDRDGAPLGDKEKMLVTQTRMIWGFSILAREYESEEYLAYAAQGVKFLIQHFWDQTYGGWNWTTELDGTKIDGGKVIYGQTFAIYTLSEYALALRDLNAPKEEQEEALEYASKTFDLLQKYAADTLNGGYYENLEPDWSRAPYGAGAGDIKSLNIHMHMLEAYTTLYECSGLEIHRRKLQEVIDLVLQKMVDLNIGCGFDQFGPELVRRPAISIPRTWTQDREADSEIADAVDTTFYGHNIELVWLLNRANDVLGNPYHTYDYVGKLLLEHSLKYGFDYEYGGVYYAGPYVGEATKLEKEWWENCEALVGYLDGYEHLKEEKYLDAFLKTWEFCSRYLINHQVGEWYQLVSRNGEVLVGCIGNAWKGIYHTGRAMLECKRRLEKILNIRES